jgi:uncharacterized membrane protein (UPF0127 family)
MKSILLPLLGATLFIILVGFLTKGSFNGKILPHVKNTPQKEVIIGSTKINVTVADSEEERKQGLSGKDKLGENEGMLFVFDTKNVYPGFWMRGMKIPIDIIWIDDEIVAKIDKNVVISPEGTPDSQLKLYYPDKPIDYVLEVHAGFSDKNGLQVGDVVKFTNL